MMIQKNCNFITNATSPCVSEIVSNSTGDILTIQISGADGEYYVEGRNFGAGDWVVLGGISLTDFSVETDGFSLPGLYEIGVIGVRQLRVRAAAMSGEVTIFGQLISSEEG